MTNVTLAQEVVVRLADKVGALASVLTPIAEARYNINAINTLSLANEAQVRLVVEKADAVVELLKKNGLTAWEQDVVAVEIANEAGAVAEVASKLAAADIDIRASIASTGAGADTTLYLWTSDNAKAVKTLV